MNKYRVDVNKEYQKAKSKMLRYTLLFSFLLTATVVGDFLLIKFANEDYLPNLIIAIIITCLFSYIAIYFFTNVYHEAIKEYNYYHSYESGLKDTSEIVILSKDDKLQYVNGLYVYALKVKYITNLETIDKTIYTMEENLDVKKGDKLLVTTYQRIIILAEKLA